MSENQTDIDLIELESLNRTSSLSNNSDSSVSSRSTLIRELITSQSSKQIIEEIDFKISQLVEAIKSKNCNDRRKKYYAKKIVSRIIDNKCSETTLNTFRNSDLASSTPYESKEKIPPPRNPSNPSPNTLIDLPKSPSPPKFTESSNRSNVSPIYYDSTPIASNRATDLKYRLKKLAEEIEQYTKTPSTLSPTHERRISEATEQLERNLDDLKTPKDLPKIVAAIPKSPVKQKIDKNGGGDIQRVHNGDRLTQNVSQRTHNGDRETQNNNNLLRQTAQIHYGDRPQSQNEIPKVEILNSYPCNNQRTQNNGQNCRKNSYDSQNGRSEAQNAQKHQYERSEVQNYDQNAHQNPQNERFESRNPQNERFESLYPQRFESRNPQNELFESRNPQNERSESRIPQNDRSESRNPQNAHFKPQSLERNAQKLQNERSELQNLYRNVQNVPNERSDSRNSQKSPNNHSETQNVNRNAQNSQNEASKPQNSAPLSQNLQKRVNVGQNTDLNSLERRDEEVQTSFEVKIVEKSHKNVAEIQNFEDLTPKSLSIAYKSEFGEPQIFTEPDQNQQDIEMLENQQNKDWKSYKTTSEKIFEKNELSRKMAKEYIIKYARKEKERQIEWISNEIKSLTRLKELLEKNSVDNLSLSSLSSENNSGTSSRPNFNCTGTKTLKEINTCLEELRQILNEKKIVVKNGLRKRDSTSSTDPESCNIQNSRAFRTKSGPTQIDFKKTEVRREKSNDGDQFSKKIDSEMEKINGYTRPTDQNQSTNVDKTRKNSQEINQKIDSESESVTSYQILCKKFTKPTDFEVKYFHESNFLSSSSEDKENFYRNNFPESISSKKSIQVQTSFQNSPKFSKDLLFGAGDFHNLKKTNSEMSNLTKNRSVAYILTFEEANFQNGHQENFKTLEKTSLEKIVMKIPPPRKQKSKFTSAVASEMDLQEALVKNRGDFVKAAEWRRQCINELTYMRDKRYEDINKRILFTTKEMRDITSKRYKHSSEVQNKLKTQKNQLQKLFNRQLANVFSKKLQEKTLKGQVTIDTAKTVTYS